jgi:hypothetical protein
MIINLVGYAENTRKRFTDFNISTISSNMDVDTNKLEKALEYLQKAKESLSKLVADSAPKSSFTQNTLRDAKNSVVLASSFLENAIRSNDTDKRINDLYAEQLVEEAISFINYSHKAAGKLIPGRYAKQLCDIRENLRDAKNEAVTGHRMRPWLY